MRILVTGALGFIGGHLSSALAEAGHDVICAVRRAGVVSPKASVYVADLSEVQSLPESIDLILHCAASTMRHSHDIRRLVRDNALVSSVLADLAAKQGVPRAIYLSSISAFGIPAGREVNIGSPAYAPNLYGATKLVGELAFCGTLPTIALRLPGVLGPAATEPWLARTLLAALDVGKVVLHSPDSLFNNVVDVRDLEAFVVGLVERSWTASAAVALGATMPVRISDLGRMIERATAAKVTFVQNSAHPAFSINIDGARNLGWKSRDIPDMIDDFIAATTNSSNLL